MATIGKPPRSVNRVKSEYTLTGPRTSRSGTPALSHTPANTRIPVSTSSTSPQTKLERKKFISRRKLVIGDAKPQLTRSSPSTKVCDIIHNDSMDKFNPCTCDPELLGEDASNVNCTYMNICNEHRQGRFRWKACCWWLWRWIERITQILLATVIVFATFNIALNGVFWLFGGKYTKGDAEDAIEESMFYDEEEQETDESERNLMELNPGGFSLTETTNALTLLDILIMTLESFFGWIGTILLPAE